ncbi:efflux RND transporter periplasmic adaptor subunit [Candidatus Magnetaquicoccus inordinatus]|uniref:efflux RND transporter periplasmic adaptor subunit n=1 Tax=Candidatus Magnetaquicoccus inordinatus TaxID=2496818 RepID=UPI00187D2EFA|nr:efflux RND transporter periplasmic adaptor subunit [Candidatus Magnetaquicoccus inordinatus]
MTTFFYTMQSKRSSVQIGCCRSSARRLLSALLLAVALCVVWAAPALAGEKLTTQTVLLHKQPAEMVFAGTVEAVKQATMSSQVSGQIVEINFDVNDFVNKGQVLLRIKGDQRLATLSLAQAGVEEAKAALAQANSELARSKQLYDKQMLTSAKMDAATAAQLAAQARLRAAQAQVAGASDVVADNVIRAPYSGYVLERFVQVGESATPGKAIFSGMSLDELRVLVAIPQTVAPLVRQRQQARILLPDGKGVLATQMTLFPYADKVAHTFAVRVAVPEGSKGLFPGMVVKVAFTVGEKEFLRIPVTAVVQRSEVSGLYVVDAEERIHFRRVLLGHRDDEGQIEVLAGVVAGERVALDPLKAGVALQAAGKGSH